MLNTSLGGLARFVNYRDRMHDGDIWRVGLSAAALLLLALAVFHFADRPQLPQVAELDCGAIVSQLSDGSDLPEATQSDLRIQLRECVRRHLVNYYDVSDLFRSR